MKPNDEAIDAARKAYCEAAVSPMEMALEAAYAAQFKSEDYAGLIKLLLNTTEHMACSASVEQSLWNKHSNACLDAADALEALLAERDALKAELIDYKDAAASKSDFANEQTEKYRKLQAERDALAARLQAAADRLEKLAGDIRPPNSVTPQLFMLSNAMKQNAQQSDRNVHLAPVEDEALVEIVADAIDTPCPSLTWEEREGAARAAIDAYGARLNKEIIAAIRRGK